MYLLARTPAATSAACTMAVTDPLPLVPAMWSVVNVRSGCPRAAQSPEMLSSPSLMPDVSSVRSRLSALARRRCITVARHGGGCPGSRRGLVRQGKRCKPDRRNT